MAPDQPMVSLLYAERSKMQEMELFRLCPKPGTGLFPLNIFGYTVPELPQMCKVGEIKCALMNMGKARCRGLCGSGDCA